jgi:hypothetical protein
MLHPKLWRQLFPRFKQRRAEAGCFQPELTLGEAQP